MLGESKKPISRCGVFVHEVNRPCLSSAPGADGICKYHNGTGKKQEHPMPQNNVFMIAKTVEWPTRNSDEGLDISLDIFGDKEADFEGFEQIEGAQAQDNELHNTSDKVAATNQFEGEANAKFCEVVDAISTVYDYVLQECEYHNVLL